MATSPVLHGDPSRTRSQQFAFRHFYGGVTFALDTASTQEGKGEDPELVAPVGVAALAIGMGAATVVPASAANNIKPFGQQETLNDYVTGAPMIGYTVTGLSPSSDAVPHNGQLYAATVTVEGLGGWATPLVPLFNARAESGQNYRVIANAPGGPAAAPPGGSTTGKVYSTSWATLPTASCTTTAPRICLFGSQRTVPEWVVAPRTPQASPPRSSAVHLLKVVR